jgi:hypothetical protein
VHFSSRGETEAYHRRRVRHAEARPLPRTRTREQLYFHCGTACQCRSLPLS